jgi:hypothetical protein
MRALILALALLAAPAAAQDIKAVQWLHARLMQSNTSVTLDDGGFSFAGEPWPYTVPAGYWLAITDIQYGSKLTDGGAWQRASYFLINGIVAVPDNGGSVHFRVPVIVPPGTRLVAGFINNDPEAQWMTSIVTGLLIPQQPGQTYRDAAVFLLKPPVR